MAEPDDLSRRLRRRIHLVVALLTRRTRPRGDAVAEGRVVEPLTAQAHERLLRQKKPRR